MDETANDLSGLKRHAERVTAKGDEEVERLLAEAKAKCDEELKRARERAEDILKKVKETGKRDALRLEGQETSGMEIEAKKMKLVARKGVLDLVLDASLKRLGELPQERRRVILGRLLLKARAEMPKGRAYCRSEDQAQVTAAGYTFVGALNSIGGVMIESEDGSVRLDLRFETLLQQIWGRHTKDIVAVLFE
jgi:V/A-type H+-transporting ATPase subunit E